MHFGNCTSIQHPPEFQRAWGTLGVAVIQNVLESINPGATIHFVDRQRQVRLCYPTEEERDRCVHRISQMASKLHVYWSPIAKRDGDTTVVVTLTCIPNPVLVATGWRIE